MRARPYIAVLTLALAALTVWTALPARAAAPPAPPVVADLSKYVISIDSGFTGTDVLLYGAVEDEGDENEGDVVIVVRGPPERVVVRRKDRVAGIWMNRDDVEFGDVPAYYMVASSRPLEEIAQFNFRALHQIGLDALRLTPLVDRPDDEIATFREALIRNRIRDRLYSDGFGTVKFLSNRLFSTPVHFPANVPEGSYRAEVFLIRDGKVIHASETPLFINKAGFQWEVHHYARAEPELYGLAAIVIALAAGWIAAVMFRKT